MGKLEEFGSTFSQEFLQKVRVGSQHSISYEIANGLADWRMRDISDDITQSMVRHLEASVLQHRCPQETVYARGRVAVELPATWWQHWKMDHAGSRWWGWVTRCWPVRTRTVTMATAQVAAKLDKSVIFPQATHVYPGELGRPVVWLALSDTYVVHEHDEYDLAKLHGEYREYLRTPGMACYGYVSFEQWLQQRDGGRVW